MTFLVAPREGTGAGSGGNEKRLKSSCNLLKTAYCCIIGKQKNHAEWRKKMISVLMSLLFVIVLAGIRSHGLKLSRPLKVACLSFGLPPVLSCPTGSKLTTVAGSSCFGCYAQGGNCRRANVKNLLFNNWEAIQNMTRAEIVARFLELIPQGAYFFRWMWSGDVPNGKMWQVMLEVADNRPRTKFLLFTKEKPQGVYGKEGNFIVRASHAMCDTSPDNLGYDAMVVTKSGKIRKGGYVCPGDCSECRFCWSIDPRTVYFRWHGEASTANRCRKAGMDV